MRKLFIFWCMACCVAGVAKPKEDRSNQIDFDGEVIDGVRQPLDSLTQVIDRDKAKDSDKNKTYPKQSDFKNHGRTIVRDIAETY